MKKLFVLFMTATLICSLLCACSNKTGTVDESSDNDQNNSGMQQDADGNNASLGNDGLRLLSDRYNRSACVTQNGYYYLTFETTKLRDGSYGMHLMYMDFASGREIYLCSTAGCKHDSPDCPSVFLYDDFPPFTTIFFAIGDHLYILSRDDDDDGSVSQDSGSVSQDSITMGSWSTAVESRPAVLYRAYLDGTERKKIYTFDAALTLEDKVIGNDKGIYVITKKLSTDKDGDKIYTTSSERKLMFLDLGSLSLNEVCSMDFGDHISWRIIGCSQDDFLLCGTDFGRELSRDEHWNDDVYKGLYEKSYNVYALLSRDGVGPKEITRQSNKYVSSAKLLGDSLYLSSEENQNIEALDIKTGEKRTLCTLSQNLIMDTLGDRLCCRSWGLAGDPIWYFVDTKTGEITHSPLKILCNGWSIDFRGETAQDVLFVYDYDATDHKDGSYSVHQYKHALISKDDLFAGKDNYRRIGMIGPGQ